MSSKRKHSGKHHAAHKSEDRLRRETPFMGSVKFRNGLPEVPCDPKMLITPLDTESIAKFQLTSLEQQMRQDLLLDSGSGIQISMLDVDRYVVPDGEPELDKEDQALLAGFERPVEDRKGAAPARERLRGQATELNWLMRTTYIAHEHAPGKARQRDAAGLSNGQVEGLGSREELLEDIEAEFAAAEKPPRHLRNPSLEPMEILPVLPALEHEQDHFTHIKFDGEPTEDIPQLAGLSEAEKRRVADHAAIKSYNYTIGTAPVKLLALLLPKDNVIPEDLPSSSAGVGRGEREDVYEWVREYDYRVHPQSEQEQSYWFAFGEHGVTYQQLNNRIHTQRNSKHKATPGFYRPIEVRVKRRAQTDEQIDESDRVKRQAHKAEDDDEQDNQEAKEG